jgi:hypothetical protein
MNDCTTLRLSSGWSSATTSSRRRRRRRAAAAGGGGGAAAAASSSSGGGVNGGSEAKSASVRPMEREPRPARHATAAAAAAAPAGGGARGGTQAASRGSRPAAAQRPDQSSVATDIARAVKEVRATPNREAFKALAFVEGRWEVPAVASTRSAYPKVSVR